MHQAFSNQHNGICATFCKELFIWSVERGTKYALAYLLGINSSTYLFLPQPYT
jgi:hypothetical protein